MTGIAQALVAEGPEVLGEFLAALDSALMQSQGIDLEQFLNGADLEGQADQPAMNAEAPMPPAGADGRGRVVLR